MGLVQSGLKLRTPMSVPQLIQVLKQYPDLALVREAFADFVDGKRPCEEELRRVGSPFCAFARSRQVAPEALLLVVREGIADTMCCEGSLPIARQSQQRVHRMTRAIDVLLETYFSDESRTV